MQRALSAGRQGMEITPHELTLETFLLALQKRLLILNRRRGTSETIFRGWIWQGSHWRQPKREGPGERGKLPALWRLSANCHSLVCF